MARALHPKILVIVPRGVEGALGLDLGDDGPIE
jgi:hypothetical protein